MRQGAFIAACAAATLIFQNPARAQVAVNPQALEQLAGKPAAGTPEKKPAAPVHRPARRPVHRDVRTRPLPLPPPPMPLPAAAAIPLPKPPPPAPAVPAAPRPKPRTIVITFSGTGTTFAPDAANELQDFVAHKAPPGARYFVRATAPGTTSDPSVARRRSLDRGLAVRGILRQAGIANDRIIVQALGNPPGLPTDRVTLTEIP